MTPKQFRSTAAWQRARKQALRGKVSCEICGDVMVTFLGPRHRLAPSVDHITPLDQIDLGSAEGRAFALSQRNLRVCHIGCNSKRGNRTKRVPRVWNLNDYVTGRSQRW